MADDEDAKAGLEVERRAREIIAGDPILAAEIARQLQMNWQFAAGGLTKKQRDVYLWIREFISVKGYSPSMREIMEGCDFKALGRIHGVVMRLVDRGFLTYTPGKSRSLKLVTRR